MCPQERGRVTLGSGRSPAILSLRDGADDEGTRRVIESDGEEDHLVGGGRNRRGVRPDDAAVAGPDGNPGRQENEIGKEPATYGQSFNLLRVDYLADLRAARLYGGSLFRDNHLFGVQSDLQARIYCGGLADAQRDAGASGGGESLGRYRQLVNARGQIRRQITSAGAGLRLVPPICLGFAQCD